MHKTHSFSALLLAVLPSLGSCGYPIGPAQPFRAGLDMMYTPGGACPGMVLLNHSSEAVYLSAAADSGSSAQQLTLTLQPGGSQPLATAFATPYTRHSLSSKGNSQENGNVIYALGARCSATSAEVTSNFTLQGGTIRVLALAEDASGGLTLRLLP